VQIGVRSSNAAGRWPDDSARAPGYLRSLFYEHPLARASALLFLAAYLVANGSVAQSDDPVVARARALHERIITFDAHADIPLDFATETADPGKDTPGQIDLPKMDRGGLSGAAFALFAFQGKRTPENYQKAHEQGLTKLRAIHRMAAFYPSRIEIARSPADIRRIHGAGKHFAVISMLNGFTLGPLVENLDEYYEGGLRQIGFTHAGNNALADSSRPQAKHGDTGPEHGGLSEVGRELVREMNRRGMIVDVSQLTPAALAEAIQISSAPVVASHSAVMAIVDTPRNLADEDMQRVADSGGVVHIVAFSAYLRNMPEEFLEEMAQIRRRFNVTEEAHVSRLDLESRQRYDRKILDLLRRAPPATVADLVTAIDYTVKLIGIDHVGIATDFNHGGGLIGFQDESEAYNVTAELMRRGYSDEDIAKIWGENWLRVFQAVTEQADEEFL
jgi:membrane dipeptidase